MKIKVNSPEVITSCCQVLCKYLHLKKNWKTDFFKQSVYSHFPYYVHEQRKSGLCQITYTYHDRKNFKAFLKNFSRTANRKILNSQHKQKLGLGQFLTEATKSHIKKCVEKFEIKSKQTSLNCWRTGHKFDFFFGFLLSWMFTLTSGQ